MGDGAKDLVDSGHGREGEWAALLELNCVPEPQCPGHLQVPFPCDLQRQKHLAWAVVASAPPKAAAGPSLPAFPDLDPHMD